MFLAKQIILYNKKNNRLQLLKFLINIIIYIVIKIIFRYLIFILFKN